ncbi:hypothetical protein P7K49_013347, partial [Saguinus oedipus]
PEQPQASSAYRRGQVKTLVPVVCARQIKLVKTDKQLQEKRGTAEIHFQYLSNTPASAPSQRRQGVVTAGRLFGGGSEVRGEPASEGFIRSVSLQECLKPMQLTNQILSTSQEASQVQPGAGTQEAKVLDVQLDVRAAQELHFPKGLPTPTYFQDWPFGQV